MRGRQQGQEAQRKAPLKAQASQVCWAEPRPPSLRTRCGAAPGSDPELSSPTVLATCCYFFPKREARRRPHRAFCPQGFPSPLRNPAAPEGPSPGSARGCLAHLLCARAPALYSENLRLRCPPRWVSRPGSATRRRTVEGNPLPKALPSPGGATAAAFAGLALGTLSSQVPRASGPHCRTIAWSLKTTQSPGHGGTGSEAQAARGAVPPSAPPLGRPCALHMW